MELNKVNQLLQDAAGACGPGKPDQAIQNIALALMHIAQAVDQIEKDIAVVRSRQLVP
jgi:hypothetical protein